MITHSLHCADLFPVPLVIDNFGESARELNRALVADIEREMTASPAGAGRSFVSGWQSRTGLEKTYASFGELHRQIEKSTHTYLHHIRFAGPRSARCGGLWANCASGRGSHSELHIHGSGNVIATGVYYPATLAKADGVAISDLNQFDPASVFVPTGVGGELVLYDPSYATKRQIIKPEQSRYYDAQKLIAPRESILVMFPQYLPHAVSPLLADGIRRYSISYAVEYHH
jgi:hypothetical protein